MVHSVLFYLQLNNVEHMETEHPAREEHPFSKFRFSFSSKGSFICTIQQTG